MHPLAIVRRVAGSLVLVWLVLSLTFVLVRLAPGDPATMLVPPTATAADAARVRAELGLDRPIVVQYVDWAARLLRGDLGESFARREPVARLIADALPRSLALGGASILLTFLIGVPIGLLQAAKRGSVADTTLTIATVTLYAAPTFWVALALVAVFTYGAATWGFPQWIRLPAFGVETPGAMLSGYDRFVDVIRHSVLPVGILAAVGAAGIARYVRSSAADLARADFVRTAMAKGASARRVQLTHVLRVILPTIIVLLGLSLPGVVAGSVFVESVFAWPGMGRLMLSAINARDYPVVLGAAGVYAMVVVVANLAADLALPALDPRRR